VGAGISGSTKKINNLKIFDQIHPSILIKTSTQGGDYKNKKIWHVFILGFSQLHPPRKKTVQYLKIEYWKSQQWNRQSSSGYQTIYYHEND
jgi:hypothetical protein